MINIHITDLILGPIILLMIGILIGTLIKNGAKTLDYVIALLSIVTVGLLLIILFDFTSTESYFHTDNENMLDELLIGLSALLAATTIIKTIYKTSQIELKKEDRELYDKRVAVYNEIKSILADEERRQEHLRELEAENKA